MDVRFVDGRGFRYVLFWAVLCGVVVLDQATKAIVQENLAPGQQSTFIPGVLNLELVRNTGAAFSIGQGAGIFFVAVALAVLVAVILMVYRQKDLPLALVVSLSCVAGGGLGNMIDRIINGYVTDFFATSFMDFPVFNVADVFVTVGVAFSFVGYLVWDGSRSRGPEESQAV